MKSFSSFFTEEAGRGKLTASGPIGAEHKKKYIDPHVGSNKFSHHLAAEHDDLPKGSAVKIHKVEHINNKVHVHAEDETGNHHVIPHLSCINQVKHQRTKVTIMRPSLLTA